VTPSHQLAHMWRAAIIDDMTALHIKRSVRSTRPGPAFAVCGWAGRFRLRAKQGVHATARRHLTARPPLRAVLQRVGGALSLREVLVPLHHGLVGFLASRGEGGRGRGRGRGAGRSDGKRQQRQACQ
jgi:hypothetical protein